MRRTKRGQEVQVSRRFDLWIELDFDNNNNRVTLSVQAHPDDKKSQWKKVASKEITMKEFSVRRICKRRD